MEEELRHLRLTDVAEELQDLVIDHSDYLKSAGPVTFPASDEATFVVEIDRDRIRARYRVTIVPESGNGGE